MGGAFVTPPLVTGTWRFYLRWARVHECPWDEPACALAAAGEHLEMMRWATRETRGTRRGGQRSPHPLRFPRRKNPEGGALVPQRGAFGLAER
jgi:hypothetical protein